MKMDAMQKQRTRRLAIAHLLLSAVVGFSPLFLGMGSMSKDSPNALWFSVEPTLFTLLEPQFWLFWKFGSFHISDLAATILLFVSVLFWSFCFSWIFVKLDNWLNHFPVLGKKVF
jgi:hypothetical protein